MAKPEHLLFEIGTEEIPSDYVVSACDNIREKAPALLEECGYKFDSVEAYSTPRRFVIFVSNIVKKPSETEERVGISKELAYQDGKPSLQFSGFLKSVGKSESDVHWKETPKGLRAAVFVKKEVKPLRHFFETLPRQIEFPKLMRWSSTGFTFTRPVRWTFALLGKSVQSYMIGDVKSESFTYGHRFLANRKIKVANADLVKYEKLLKSNHVILKMDDRIAMIQGFLKNANNHDETLTQTVANLTEEPFAIEVTFQKDHLSLPPDVLATCMRKNQKVFACYDKQGKLINKMVVVINGRRRDPKKIAENYLNVLESRLVDAKFFYNEDTKTSLEDKVEKLSGLIFLGKLGSYLDKTKRLETLADFLAKQIKVQEIERRFAIQAATLCKADLTTHLVYEFPELQGVAGREYARHDHLHEEIARAVADHYLPRNLGEKHDSLKKQMSASAAIVAIADRIDLLVGAFGIGIEPSGSQDPYALRRAAGGIVKLARAFNLSFLLPELVQKTADLYGDVLKVKAQDIMKKLKPFIRERIYFEFDLKPGTKSYEIMQAVYEVSSENLADVFERFSVLKSFYEGRRDEFLKVCKIVERTSNILKGAKSHVDERIDPSNFKEKLENELYELACVKEPEFKKMALEKKYGPLTGEFGKVFYQPIHDFFDKVLVNVPDEKVRSNRLALMKKVNRLYTDSVADLSLISGLNT